MSVITLVCRSCLTVNRDMINLFSQIEDSDNLTLSDCFNMCTNIKIENEDNMPQTICEDCLSELKVAYSFRAKCEKSDYILRNQYKTELKYETYGEGIVFGVLEDSTSLEQIEIEYQEEIPLDQSSTEIKEQSSPVEQTPKSWILHQVEEIDHIELVDNVKLEVEVTENPETLDEDDVPLSEFCISNTVESETDENYSKIDVDKKTLSTNWFECDQCKKGFKLKLSLQKHMDTAHNGKTLHLCNFCGKLCTQESSLKSHLLQHQGERPFKCDHCDKTYFTKNGLQSHVTIHTNEKPEAKFLCSVCGKGFTTHQRLRIHTFTHTGERNYSCDLCDKSFATEFRLRSHRRTHTGERPYECVECGLTFAQGNALKCHKRVHTGEKPYCCKFCGKRFSQNTILKTHMTLHTGKTVKCPDCDKKFSRASYLILHRREHTGEKPYVCDRCPNRYKQKSHLDRHMDTHLGVKHKCEICSKEYSKQWSLKMHMFTHSEEKPFKCSECAQTFIRKDKYKTHLKVHHGQTLLDAQKSSFIIVQDASQYVQIKEVNDNSKPPMVTTVISAIPKTDVKSVSSQVKKSSP